MTKRRFNNPEMMPGNTHKKAANPEAPLDERGIVLACSSLSIATEMMMAIMVERG